MSVEAVIAFCDDALMVLDGLPADGRPEPDPERGRPIVSLAET